MATTLFDTHCHLDAAPLADDPAAELDAARSAGVGRWIVPGVRRGGWPALLALADRFPGVWAAPGLHPLAADSWDAEAAAELAALLAEPRVAAVGEIGLDHLLTVPREAQERAFRAQLRLAIAAGKPVLLHCRRANARLLELLREEGAQRVGGIWHGFSGSPQSAREAIDLGFAVAVNGVLTWEGARRAPAVVKALPPEWLVLETDAPDLAPVPHRGTPNRAAYLALVAAEVAHLRGWSLAETARLTTVNACRVLHLPEEITS
jgi:TatD DNase family protein